MPAVQWSSGTTSPERSAARPGERQRLGVVARAEMAARDDPGGEVGLDRVEQRLDRGLAQQGLGLAGAAVADQLLDLLLPACTAASPAAGRARLVR